MELTSSVMGLLLRDEVHRVLPRVARCSSLSFFIEELLEEKLMAERGVRHIVQYNGGKKMYKGGCR